jgi:hypothetical protein
MKHKPTPIDKSAARYEIRTSRRGILIGISWSEPYGHRRARALAEERGEPVNLLDLWTRRRIRGYNPSRAAVERAKIKKGPTLTTGGHDADAMHWLFLGTRPHIPRDQPLSDRAEDPTRLPLRPTLPDAHLFDIDLSSHST